MHTEQALVTETYLLNCADAFKLVAVFDSESTSTDAAPQMTITGTVGNFVRGEIITGGTTGKPRIITVSSPMEYVLTDGVGPTDFNSGEVITGSSSAATATVGTVTAGSKIITSNYVLDTGQRDNFYDISRIIRKLVFHHQEVDYLSYLISLDMVLVSSFQ